jgi:hypothetical protein
MILTLEAKQNAVVNQPLALQSLPDAHFGKQLDRSLLEHASAHTLFDMLASVHLKYHGIDSFEM